MTDLNQTEQKELFKQAIKEWMTERYADVGRWTVKVILTTALTGFLWAYIQARGFKLP
jgi:adenine/guanine phosphoribosyltransferase-like PRPP-binding protein